MLWGFPGDAVVKNPPANAEDARDTGSIPGLGRSPIEGNDNLLHYSCLENYIGRRAWLATVHGIAKNWTQLSTHTRLSDVTFTLHFHALEKEMATHSSILAWKIPWTEETGRLQSVGSQTVVYD